MRVDMQHTRKSWAAAGLQYRCSVWDLISTYLSQKVQVGLDLSEPVSRNVSPWFERDPLLSWSVLFFIRDIVAICGFTFGNSFLCKEKKLPAGRQQSVFSLGSNYFHTLGWGSLWHLKQEIEYWVTHVLHPNF